MIIEWKAEASADLERVIDYVASNRPGDEALDVSKLVDAVELLGTQPSMGRPGRVTGTREWPGVFPWVVIYRVERKTTLVILRVLHGRQKWPPEPEPPKRRNRRSIS
jgi:plasmid stabilization system protein ParE